MTVTMIDGQWFATDGNTKIGPFPSHAHAWAWLDQADPEHTELLNRYARIREAFSE